MRGGRLLEVGVAALAGSMLGAGLVGAHGGDSSQIHSCQQAGQPLRQVVPDDASCAANQGASVDWAAHGPTGATGARGPAGATGPAGAAGPAYRLRVASKIVTGNSFVDGTVRCAAGELAVSGGWLGGTSTSESGRRGPDGWAVEVSWPTVGLTWGYENHIPLTVYAVCAKAVA